MAIFKEVIEKHYKSKPKKKYDGMMPSASMLGACPRASYAKLKNVRETTPPDVHAQQNFEVGNVTEAVIARALDQQELLISWWTDSQQYGARFHKEDWNGDLREDEWIDKELGIKGTPDIIAKSKDDIVLVDVKTASTKSTSFTLRKIKKGTFWEESLGYKYQLGCYLLLTKRRYEAGLEQVCPDYGKLVIIDKNNGSIIAEPTLFLDEALEVEIINRIEYLNALFAQDELPPCDCDSGWKKYFGVAYCSYGVLESIKPNSKKKMVPTQCCDAEYIISNIEKNAD